MISNILIKQGYKVGKFMSPHLIRYNERISINGKEISNKEMKALINELQPKVDRYNKNNKSNVTLFELETIMALLYFYRNNVDFSILETGLGGLYDCTNIISKPLVSIITSIGYDHMHILGDNLPDIAYQKAGIIKKNSKTVFFEQEKEVNDVFIKECEKRENELHLIKKEEIRNYKFNKKLIANSCDLNLELLAKARAFITTPPFILTFNLFYYRINTHINTYRHLLKWLLYTYMKLSIHTNVDF